jgi:hypothetical protein
MNVHMVGFILLMNSNFFLLTLFGYDTPMNFFQIVSLKPVGSE